MDNVMYLSRPACIITRLNDFNICEWIFWRIQNEFKLRGLYWKWLI